MLETSIFHLIFINFILSILIFQIEKVTVSDMDLENKNRISIKIQPINNNCHGQN